MTLPLELHVRQSRRWPSSGRHILACHDEKTIVVYQAYAPAIGAFAIAHGRLGGDGFRFGRMSWIKPSFLWMMYRSGWGTKHGQQVVLGLRIRRSFFDEILEAAVPSRFDDRLFAPRSDYQTASASCEVRLQWDPDHAPNGAAIERRAIQLGLRGRFLQRFASEEILEVVDSSPLVAEQRRHVGTAALATPRETTYLPSREAARVVRLDAFEVAS